MLKRQKWQWIVRIFFLSLFLLLLYLTTFPLPAFPTNLFFRIDPYFSLLFFLSSHRLSLILLPGLVILVFFLWGKRKIFCQWFCPLGTVFSFASLIRRKRSKAKRFPILSFYILGFFLGLAIFSIPIGGFLDPFSFLVKAIVSRPFLFSILVLFLLHIFYPFFWCSKICPLGGLLESLSIKRRGINFARRKFILSFLTGIAIGATLKLRKKRPVFIRPPGALAEEEFISKCLRCGECMKVCPTGTIHLQWFEGGLESLFTPYLILRKAPCSFCFSCGIVCPTGAISKNLRREEVKIGRAVIDRERCITWKRGIQCGVCYKNCPSHAIFLDGKGRPHVNAEKCSGCGVCEFSCPVEGDSAIRVFPLEERNYVKL